MDRKTYEHYLSLFNARDYDAFLQFYDDSFEASFLEGIRFSSKEDIKKFYKFLHDYIIETITITRFVSDDTMIAVEAVMRIEGKKDLTPELASAAGFPTLYPISQGRVMEIPQFFHYYLKNKKICGLRCAVVQGETA